MKYIIREIDKSSEEELKIVTERCIETVLETIPEFQNDLSQAQKYLPNLNFVEMSSMIKSDFNDSSKRIMVVQSESKKIIAHSIYSWKMDENSKRYGFCFSRYTSPRFRKHGIASKLLNDAFDWFRGNECEYVVAHTHVTNSKLLGLFKKNGFMKEGPLRGACLAVLFVKKTYLRFEEKGRSREGKY